MQKILFVTVLFLMLSSCITEDLRELDRKVIIDGSGDVIANGLYEYSVRDSCLPFIATCTYQTYVVRNVTLSGSTNISLPLSNSYSGNSFRIVSYGEGSATVTIQLLDDDENIRDVTLSISAYIPDNIVIDCCNNSAKIPLGETATISVIYYYGTTSLRTPTNYLGITMPPNFSLQSITNSNYSDYDRLAISAPAFKVRELINSNLDASINFELHAYDVFDVDEIQAVISSDTAGYTEITPSVRIENIRPLKDMDFDYFYSVQTPLTCQLGEGIFEKEALTSVIISKIASGNCDVNVTLRGVIESRILLWLTLA